jgi:hypothetical protein
MSLDSAVGFGHVLRWSDIVWELREYGERVCSDEAISIALHSPDPANSVRVSECH